MAKKDKNPIGLTIHERYIDQKAGTVRIERTKKFKRKGKTVSIKTSMRKAKETGMIIAGSRDMAHMSVDISAKKHTNLFKNPDSIANDIKEAYYSGLERVAQACVDKYKETIESKGGKNESDYIGRARASTWLRDGLKWKRSGKYISIYSTCPYFRRVEEGWQGGMDDNIDVTRFIEWMRQKGITNSFKDEKGIRWGAVVNAVKTINHKVYPGRYYFMIASDETLRSRIFVRRMIREEYKKMRKNRRVAKKAAKQR